MQCHQPGGPASRAVWDARITTPTSAANLVNALPANNFGSPNNFILAPQSPTNSVLLTRLSARDLGSLPSIQMPPLASNLTNAAATQLITDWINSLPTDGSAAKPVFNFTAPSGTNLILRGSNGWPGQIYFLRTATNLALPRTNWTFALTNTFDPSGIFNLTNPLNPATPGNFYLLQLP